MKRKCKTCGNEFVVRYKNQWYCDKELRAMGRRNKRAGASNELRFFKKLQKELIKHGFKYKVRRTPRSGSIHEFEPSDGLWSGLPSGSTFNVHMELKNTSSWSIHEWYDKARELEKERGTNRQPIIVARKPNSQDEFMIMSSDLGIKLMIMAELLNYEQEKQAS